MGLDSAGKFILIGSGVIINPNVVLTAGHVNFKTLKQVYGNNCSETGYISIGNNCFKPDKRIAFNWIRSVETYPDLVNKGVYDYPEDFTHIADIGLIFLDQPVLNITPINLPDSNSLGRIKKDDLLLGAGYGITKTLSSYIKDSVQKAIRLADGNRRFWKPHEISVINELWFKTSCDPLTNRPYLGLCNSGSPLLLNNTILIGIWDNGGSTCPTFMSGTRIDNPKILKWIKEYIKMRIESLLK